MSADDASVSRAISKHETERHDSEDGDERDENEIINIKGRSEKKIWKEFAERRHTTSLLSVLFAKKIVFRVDWASVSCLFIQLSSPLLTTLDSIQLPVVARRRHEKEMIISFETNS